jgi:hypothetical protein
MPQHGEKKAGGMTYQTLEGARTSALNPYLEGQDNQSQWVIFKRNQDYYIASADKTIARLKLAKTRVKCTEISGKQYLMLMDKISKGLNWLKALKNEIKSTDSNQDLQAVISYKKWHAVKLIPSAAEGYAIANAINIKINQLNIIQNNLTYKKQLEDAISHNKLAEDIFSYLLNLEETSDFSNAEKRRVEGFEEIGTAQILVNSIQRSVKSL